MSKEINIVDKDQIIADLETKLAESEKDRLMWQEMYKNADRQNKNICETDIYPLQEENQQLKQQLAEKPKEIALQVIDSVKEFSVFDFKAYEELNVRKYIICESTLDVILKKYLDNYLNKKG